MTPGNHGTLQKLQPRVILILFLTLTRLGLSLGVAGGEIGVDYGLNGDDLPSPEQTVALLKSKGIARVRMYETRQEITKAFANSGIELLLGISNEMVPKMAANLVEAFNWVTQNVIPFPKSGISAIIVGNEWLLDSSHDPALLLPAMLNVYTVLTTTQVLALDLSGIKVSTSHALNVLGISFPPSLAQFNAGLLSVLSPILDFLEQTGSFFMVNVFPYFAYVADANVSLEFALFEAKTPVQDPNTKLNYTNLFDLQLDAVYAALDAAHAAALATPTGALKQEYFSVHGEDVEDEAAVGSMQRPAAITSPSHAFTLDKRRHKGRSPTHSGFKRRVANRRRPRVLVGESGWPSGPGGSGSVPHSQPFHFMDNIIVPPAPAAYVTSRQQDQQTDAIGTQDDATPSAAADSLTSSSSLSAHHEPSHAVIISRGRHPGADDSAPSADVSQLEVPPAEEVFSSEAAVRRPRASTAATSTCGGTLSARVCVAATVENARRYNQNLIRHVLQSSGTPANPTTPIHAFIFSLYNEDLKPPGPEQHYGLFFPNATPVYPITFHL